MKVKSDHRSKYELFHINFRYQDVIVKFQNVEVSVLNSANSVANTQVTGC